MKYVAVLAFIVDNRGHKPSLYPEVKVFVAARRLKVYLGGRFCRQLLTIKDFDLSMNLPSTSQRDLQHSWLLSKASATKPAICFTFHHGEQEEKDRVVMTDWTGCTQSQHQGHGWRFQHTAPW